MEKTYYVYYKSSPGDGHVCNVFPCAGHIVLERTTGTERADEWRVRELQSRGLETWFDTVLIRESFY